MSAMVALGGMLLTRQRIEKEDVGEVLQPLKPGTPMLVKRSVSLFRDMVQFL
ncbi:MAG: hypothetical protein KatS3mg057_1000 [Herpetosiphonaceae bacterium]|nr:MAG: hypothetical protein KatS3mg057_1000 [Herpetosiphonaceae bacterium]